MELHGEMGLEAAALEGPTDQRAARAAKTKEQSSKGRDGKFQPLQQVVPCRPPEGVGMVEKGKGDLGPRPGGPKTLWDS